MDGHGRLLRAARVRARLSQADVAALTHQHQTGVSRWETGKRPLSRSALLDLLTLCGARLTGDDRISDLLAPLDAEGTRWFTGHLPRERLRLAARHVAAQGRTLGGMPLPRLLAVLRLAGAHEWDEPLVVLTGPVAWALECPDVTREPEVEQLRLVAPAGHPALGLPARLPGVGVTVAAGLVAGAVPRDLGAPGPPAWLGVAQRIIPSAAGNGRA